MENLSDKSVTRRSFVASAFTAITASAFYVAPITASSNNAPLTIAQVIELIRQSITFDASKGTVDTVKSGNPDQPVTGIVSTMFATVDVVRQAISQKANLIIAHEPTFYNHLDETEWLAEHDVYKMKMELLQKHNIVVWRFHDFWHSNKPDGVLMGVLTKLGWEKYYNAEQPKILTLPSVTLKELISHLKMKLGINTLRFIGDISQTCRKVALLPGASGGRSHINVLHNSKPDVLICGELQEWETSEYIRDCRALGSTQALIVLGHAVSEEPGMQWLVQWLQPKVPGIPITHIPSGNPFTYA